MERIPNPEMDRIILDHLATKYHIMEKREGIHLSTLVYCLTRSFLSYKGAADPTDHEIVLFALGYALQDVITPPNATAPLYEQDGITYRPDMLLEVKLHDDEWLVEVKSTRKSMTKALTEPIPETWLRYIQGGCSMRGVTSYELSVIYIVSAKINSETLIFTEEELSDNWEWLMARRDVYQHALATDTQPSPFEHNDSWECDYCRYKLVCETMVRLEGKNEQ